MDHETMKQQIAVNIAAARKQAGLTQAGLAQQLNYSDKAVSKWERGESLPDATTLAQLARVLGVSADSLLYPPESCPPSPEPSSQRAGKKTRRERKPSVERLPRRRKIIAALVALLVQVLALFAHHIVSSCNLSGSWVSFVAAVPVTAIVMLSLLSAWRYYKLNQLHVTVIMWGTLVTVFLLLWVCAGLIRPQVLTYGIPGQLAIILWFQMYRKEDKA